MNDICRKIVNKGGRLNVLDITLSSFKEHSYDLDKRLNSQKKALTRARARGCKDSTSIISRSIADIKKTLTVVEQLDTRP